MINNNKKRIKMYMIIYDRKNVEIIVNLNGVFKCCYDYGDSLCEVYKLSWLRWIEVDDDEVWNEGEV